MPVGTAPFQYTVFAYLFGNNCLHSAAYQYSNGDKVMGFSRIRFDSETSIPRDWLLDNEEKAQRFLAKFKNSSSQPYCECNENKPGMYIAHRSRYYLARKPGTGSLHSPTCPSFELDQAESGKVSYENNVIRSKRDGTMSLKILAPLSQKVVDRSESAESDIDAKAPPPAERKPTERREGMSLSGLLAYLWEEAELNRWYPNFAGHRNWFIARKRLIDAAQRIVTKRMNLSDVLYLPEPFKMSEKDEIEKRRNAAYDRIMKNTSSTSKYMVVIGLIRKLNIQSDSVSIMLAHQKDSLKYWGKKHIVRKLEATPVSQIVEDENSGVIVYTLMVVSRDDNDVLHIRDIGFLPVDLRMLPSYTKEDFKLTDKLVVEERRFIKTLRYDGHRNKVLPDYFLVDMGEKPVPLAIYRNFASEAEIEERFEAQKRWKDNYGQYWIWDMENDGDNIPQLVQQSEI